jgi:hypothetical protein
LCAEEERIMTVTMRKGLLRTLGAVALGLSAAAISLGAPIAARPDDRAANEKLESLRAATRGQLRWTVSRITGAFDSVQATGEALLAVDDTSQPPEARALEFLRSHGDLLGIRFSERGAPGGLLPLRAEEEIDGFQVEKVSRDGIGQTHVRLHQFYRGVPVFGAQLVVHMDELGIRGVNGNFIPGIAVETAARLSEAEAANIAWNTLARAVGGEGLALERTDLAVYRIGLLEGFAGESRLA